MNSNLKIILKIQILTQFGIAVKLNEKRQGPEFQYYFNVRNILFVRVYMVQPSATARNHAQFVARFHPNTHIT